MTIADRNAATAYYAPPPAATPTTSPARFYFVGRRSEYWRLMIRGGVLQAITLGIYRFWLFTDVRRYLWANTEIEGESFPDPLRMTGAYYIGSESYLAHREPAWFQISGTRSDSSYKLNGQVPFPFPQTP